jgi:hypothetical protein
MDVDEKKMDEVIHTCPAIIKELQSIELRIMELRQCLIKSIKGEDDEKKETSTGSAQKS